MIISYSGIKIHKNAQAFLTKIGGLFVKFHSTNQKEEQIINLNARKTATALVDIFIAERMIDEGKYEDAADSLLQAKVLITSLLTKTELEILNKAVDYVIEAEKQLEKEA